MKKKPSGDADPEYIPSVSTSATNNNLEPDSSDSSLHYPIPYNSDMKTTSSSSSGDDGNNSHPAVCLSGESDGDDFEIPRTDIKQRRHNITPRKPAKRACKSHHIRKTKKLKGEKDNNVPPRRMTRSMTQDIDSAKLSQASQTQDVAVVELIQDMTRKG